MVIKRRAFGSVLAAGVTSSSLNGFSGDGTLRAGVVDQLSQHARPFMFSLEIAG
jgi:hypothetical protein